MLLMLNVHYTRVSDLVEPTTSSPARRSDRGYRDVFGIGAAASSRRRTDPLTANAIVNDSGEPDVIPSSRRSTSCRSAPTIALVFLRQPLLRD